MVIMVSLRRGGSLLPLEAQLTLFHLRLVAAMFHPWTTPHQASMLALARLQAEMNQWVNLAEAEVMDPVVLAVARVSRSMRF